MVCASDKYAADFNYGNYRWYMVHEISSGQSNMAEDGEEQRKSKDRSLVSQKVLFVRNLPFSTTDQDLENIFSEVGPIKRCFVIRDKGEKPVFG